VRFLVMDEADKLFEMGFVEQIDAAVGACSHPNVQRCLFSATLPEVQYAPSVPCVPLRRSQAETAHRSGVTVFRRLSAGMSNWEQRRTERRLVGSSRD
jgi:ATP-dependent RNA helicase DDX52/ROK1